MKIAATFNEIETGKISPDAANDKYIQAFAQKMMEMSNMLVESEEDAYIDVEVIKDEFLPSIREFIANTTGL
jgi:hypothetical protein